MIRYDNYMGKVLKVIALWFSQKRNNQSRTQEITHTNMQYTYIKQVSFSCFTDLHTTIQGDNIKSDGIWRHFAYIIAHFYPIL